MRRVGLALAFVLVGGLAISQSPPSNATVQTKSSKTYGSYLVDSKGLALYAFSADAKGNSTCTGKCAQAWPPLTVSGSPTAGSGVAGSLLGTAKRSDGTVQVTYGGKPLYTFVKDHAAGDTNGEGISAFGGEWDLVSPYGSAIKPPQKATKNPSTTNPVAGESTAQLMKTGHGIFLGRCAVCHGVNGGGGVGPALAGDVALSDGQLIARQVLHGAKNMPSFADKLNNQQIAAVATYVRNSWGNSYGPVSVKEVSAVR